MWPLGNHEMWPFEKKPNKNSRCKHNYNEVNSADEEKCSVFDYMV